LKDIARNLSPATQLIVMDRQPIIFSMKYVVVMLAGFLLSSCSGVEFHPERVDWDEYQRNVQKMPGAQSNAANNGIERCRYWTDYTGNVFKKCN